MIGCGSVILPNKTLYEGAAVGALSLVNRNVEAFDVVVGSPAKKIGTRDKNQLHLMEQHLYEQLSLLS